MLHFCLFLLCLPNHPPHDTVHYMISWLHLCFLNTTVMNNRNVKGYIHSFSTLITSHLDNLTLIVILNVIKMFKWSFKRNRKENQLQKKCEILQRCSIKSITFPLQLYTVNKNQVWYELQINIQVELLHRIRAVAFPPLKLHWKNNSSYKQDEWTQEKHHSHELQNILYNLNKPAL